MDKILQYLKEERIHASLLEAVEAFRAQFPAAPKEQNRIPDPEYLYYGKEVWEQAVSALLAGKNLLLAGPKASGKNVLSENLGSLFGRPVWNVSFHINMDASYLVGTDTFDGQAVSFRPGPIWLCAQRGGFGILDEINMAKNEALAVLHAALDFRRSLDVPGYEKQDLRPETRFIATMNYGYAGTRELNEALVSRFVVLDMPVITEENLDRLIESRFPGLKGKLRGQLAKLYGELQKKTESAEISDAALDLRGLLDAIALMEKGLSSGRALELCIVNKSFDSYERGLIRDVIHARFPLDLMRDDLFSE